MRYPVTITVNGVKHLAEVESDLLLIDFVREEMHLTGTKHGCDTGECGACTVLLNGEPIRSCLVLAVEADGGEVVTVEGLSGDGELLALQQNFIDAGAVQCGFCIPGILIAVKSMLDRNPEPTREQVVEAMSGHICRCTGYEAIVDAIMKTIGEA